MFNSSHMLNMYLLLLQVSVRLAHGFGMSVINSVPEEIVFTTFNRIQLDYLSNRKNKSLEFTVDNVQVINSKFLVAVI